MLEVACCAVCVFVCQKVFILAFRNFSASKQNLIVNNSSRLCIIFLKCAKNKLQRPHTFAQLSNISTNNNMWPHVSRSVSLTIKWVDWRDKLIRKCGMRIYVCLQSSRVESNEWEPPLDVAAINHNQSPSQVALFSRSLRKFIAANKIYLFRVWIVKDSNANCRWHNIISGYRLLWWSIFLSRKSLGIISIGKTNNRQQAMPISQAEWRKRG